jgi:CO/xanthine dehydrogenase Mo-binding subunit
VRLKNAGQGRHEVVLRPELPGVIGLKATLEAAQEPPALDKAKLKKNQGRGVACGFWFNFGGETSFRSTSPGRHRGRFEGTPDIGGSRASIGNMAAEELGIAADKVRCIIADTASLGYNDVTDGSRVTFASGWPPSRLRAMPSARCATAPPRSGAFEQMPWSGKRAMPGPPRPMPASTNH